MQSSDDRKSLRFHSLLHWEKQKARNSFLRESFKEDKQIYRNSFRLVLNEDKRKSQSSFNTALNEFDQAFENLNR